VVAFWLTQKLTVKKKLKSFKAWKLKGIRLNPLFLCHTLKTLTSILIVLFASFNGLAQSFTIDNKYSEAYSLLLDLKFEEASGILKKLQNQDKSNLAPIYLEDLSDFLYIVVTEDKEEFEARKELRNQRLKALKQLPDSSPYKLLSEGEIHLHWAFSKMRFGEYLSGARDINKAFNALEKNIELFPDFIPTYKSMGLLHTLIGTVPDNYRWATNLMGVDGTIDQGIAEMESVITKSSGRIEFKNVRKETLFLLSFLHINLLNDKKALVEYRTQVDKESGPLMDFAKASLLKEIGETDAAIQTLEASPASLKSFPYLNFLLGEMQLSRMDKNADLPLKVYINSFKGNSYLKSAYQKLAWHALLVKNDAALYNSQIARVSEVGNTMLDEDKSALKEFESGYAPNSSLLKARIQFDGGYYIDALKALIKSSTPSSSAAETLEFTYRLARIHDKLENQKDAISYYELTMKNGVDSKRYFAANSSLMLGLLHEKNGNSEAALKAFKECSTFNNSEYRNSIQQKAKAGIVRVID
jgi:hypothetical protein